MSICEKNDCFRIILQHLLDGLNNILYPLPINVSGNNPDHFLITSYPIFQLEIFDLVRVRIPE